MKLMRIRTSLLCLLVLIPFKLRAQETAPASPDAVSHSPDRKGQADSKVDIAQTMEEARNFRVGLTNAVVSGEKTPDEALAELQKHPLPSGLQIDSAAEYALAVVDIGQRLIAAGKPEAAEAFFIAAEKALDAVIDKTPNAAAQEKAGFLEQRALIRDNFLNKSPEADADLAKAVTLQPEDKRLARKRDLLPAGKTGRKDKPVRPN